MDIGLLTKLFGKDQQWSPPCIIILDANAAIQSVGTDSIQGGGSKVFAPRTISGRVTADAACLFEGKSMVIVQQQKHKQPTGEDVVKQSLMIVDADHIVAVEFSDTSLLSALGLTGPVVRSTGSHSGVMQRPR